MPPLSDIWNGTVTLVGCGVILWGFVKLLTTLMRWYERNSDKRQREKFGILGREAFVNRRAIEDPDPPTVVVRSKPAPVSGSPRATVATQSSPPARTPPSAPTAPAREQAKADRPNASPPPQLTRRGTPWTEEALFDELKNYDSIGMVEVAINAGVSVNARDTDDATPLHWVARKNMTLNIDILIKNGADLNAQLKGGGTAVSIAAAKGHKSIVQPLLKAGARSDLDAPLAAAAQGGHLETATLLLDHRAPVDQKNKGGWTPLHVAAAEGHADMVDLLLDRGADLWAKTPEGFTPRDCAILGKHEKALERILLWEPKRPAPPGWTPTVPEPEPERRTPQFDVSTPKGILEGLDWHYAHSKGNDLYDFEGEHCGRLISVDPTRNFDEIYQRISIALQKALAQPLEGGEQAQQRRRTELTKFQEDLDAAQRERDILKLTNLERSAAMHRVHLPRPTILRIPRTCIDAMTRLAAKASPGPSIGIVVERRSPGIGYPLGIFEPIPLPAKRIQDFQRSLSRDAVMDEGVGPKKWNAVAIYQSRNRASAELTAEDIATLLQLPDEDAFDDAPPPVDPMYSDLPIVMIALDGGNIRELRAYRWDYNNTARKDYGPRGEYIPMELKIV